MTNKATPHNPSSIASSTRIGRVTLRVADMDRSLRLYEDVIGFQQIERGPDKVVLGTADGVGLLELHESQGAPPSPAGTTGLYHLAILVPTRADLGRSLGRLLDAGIPIGQSDHLVSEALYLSDPDGDGIEIYRDRPRGTWRWSDGQVAMAVDPLDLQDLLAEGRTDPQAWVGGGSLPVGTTIGHVHLRVGDLIQAEQFYHTVLGFDVTCRFPGALFVSAGGYHHHLGLNTWQSRGAPPTPADSAGLKSYEIVLPDGDALAAVVSRLDKHHVKSVAIGEGRVQVADPWGNTIVLGG